MENRDQANVPGGSARREYERRARRQRERVEKAHPWLGRLALRLAGQPQHVQSWAVGAAGEAWLGAQVDRITGPTIRVLHDRRIPGTRANIDHLVVAGTGVYVIDTKAYKGRPQVRLGPRRQGRRHRILVVGGRDRTNLIESMNWQLEQVEHALAARDVRVTGTICFVLGDWPLFGGEFVVDGVRVLSRRRLLRHLRRPGELGPNQVDGIVVDLAASFPPA